MKSDFYNESLKNLSEYISRGITPSYTEDNGIQVLNQKCVRDGKISIEASRLHDNKKKKVSDEKILKKNDILVNSTGVGTLGRVAQKHDETIATVDTHITIVRPKKSKVDPVFLGYLLKQNQSLIESLAEGTTGQTELSRTQLGDLKFDLPIDKDIQRKIGEVMFLLDSKIEFNHRINQTLETIAQTLFKSWFVDFDPVKAKIAAKERGQDPQLAAMIAISGKTAEQIAQLPAAKRKELAETADLFPDEMAESELGMIPRGWKELALYDTADYVNGAAFKANDFSTEKLGLPIIKIAELKSGISKQTEYTLKDVPEKYRINSGDILYSWSGSPETSLEAFKWFGGEGWLNQHIFKINTNSIEQKVFVYFLLKYLKPQLIEIAKNKQTTGLGHVTVADMKRIKIVFPDKKALKFLSSKLLPAFQLSSNCIQQNYVLSKQRDTLLPRLLSGEVKPN
jgi:type I restriction enzyme S subunit